MRSETTSELLSFLCIGLLIHQSFFVLHFPNVYYPGIFPSDRRFKSMLSDPRMMRRTEGCETLAVILKEFGYSTNVVGAEDRSA